MIIKIDKEKCIGCGTCVAMAEKSFRFAADNCKVEAVDPPADPPETLYMIVDVCPTQAIVVEE